MGDHSVPVRMWRPNRGQPHEERTSSLEASLASGFIIPMAFVVGVCLTAAAATSSWYAIECYGLGTTIWAIE